MSERSNAFKYGTWYSSTNPCGVWTKIRIDWIDDYPPTAYWHVSHGRTRKPGFCALMIDRRTGDTGVYAPPMVDPPTWRPGEVPNRTGEDYLKWIEEQIANGSLVEIQ